MRQEIDGLTKYLTSTETKQEPLFPYGPYRTFCLTFWDVYSCYHYSRTPSRFFANLDASLASVRSSFSQTLIRQKGPSLYGTALLSGCKDHFSRSCISDSCHHWILPGFCLRPDTADEKQQDVIACCPKPFRLSVPRTCCRGCPILVNSLYNFPRIFSVPDGLDNHFPRGLCLLGPRIQFSRPVQAVARGVAAAFPGDFVEPCMRVGCCLETSAAQPPQQTCLTARCFPFTNTPYTSNLSLQKSTLVVRDSTEQHFEIRQATRI